MRILPTTYILFFLSAIFCLAQTEQLTIGYSESPPFIMENADGELEGISVWAWEKIAEDLNLKFRYEKRDLEEIITGLKNGSIDMSMNPLTVTAQRSQAIDFSHPFFVSNSTVAIPETSTLQKGLQFITSFFSLNFFRSVCGYSHFWIAGLVLRAKSQSGGISNRRKGNLERHLVVRRHHDHRGLRRQIA